MSDPYRDQSPIFPGFARCPTCDQPIGACEVHYCPGPPAPTTPLLPPSSLSLFHIPRPWVQTMAENRDRIDLQPDSKSRINLYIDGEYVGQLWVKDGELQVVVEKAVRDE